MPTYIHIVHVTSGVYANRNKMIAKVMNEHKVLKIKVQHILFM